MASAIQSIGFDKTVFEILPTTDDDDGMAFMKKHFYSANAYQLTDLILKWNNEIRWSSSNALYGPRSKMQDQGC